MKLQGSPSPPIVAQRDQLEAWNDQIVAVWGFGGMEGKPWGWWRVFWRVGTSRGRLDRPLYDGVCIVVGGVRGSYIMLASCTPSL